MRKIHLAILIPVLFLAGCTALQIPVYIQDKKPYTQRFYGEHGEVVAAIKKSLSDLGWEIDGTANPSVYEEGRVQDPDSENILLYTQLRQTPMVLWTTYTRLNVFVGSKNKTSDVEVRYSKIRSFPFKQFKGFRNDKLVKRMFQRITDELNQP